MPDHFETAASVKAMLNPTVEDMIVEVARAYNLEPGDMLGRGRSHSVARARQMAIYLLTMSGAEESDITDMLGIDVTTLYYSIGRIVAAQLRGEPIQETAELICERLEGNLLT